ncbi:MAG: DUF2225 domain-containing protein [Deltaproteobacteria bacterium]|nr:DUF2225 domain-containing protein [Deltaproteobacteria bacterium]
MTRSTFTLGLALWLLVMQSSPVLATTMHKEEVSCPICGQKLTVRRIMSTNNFGGQDRDFCEHARGAQPLLVGPTTCARCLFTGYPDDFDKKPGPELEALRKQLLEQKPLKARGPLELNWVRRDLHIQYLMLSDALDERLLADMYLRIAWAVRLEMNPLTPYFHRLTEEQHGRVEKLLPKEQNARRADKARGDLLAARFLIAKIDELEREEKEAALIAAAYMLRNRGEHGLLSEILPKLKEVLPEGEAGSLIEKTKASIELEQAYQRKALAAIDEHLKLKSLPDEGFPDSMKVYVYLAGELARRVGDLDRARSAYRRVIRLQPVDWLRKLAQEQLALVEKKH